jgi:hypothetical protein
MGRKAPTRRACRVAATIRVHKSGAPSFMTLHPPFACRSKSWPGHIKSRQWCGGVARGMLRVKIHWIKLILDNFVTNYLRTGLLALLFAFGVPAFAQDTQAEHDVAELSDLSGLSSVIQSIPENFIDLSDLSDDDIDTLRELLTTSFDAKALSRDVQTQLQADYVPVRAATVLALLRKPLSRKITALEEQANSPASAQAFKDFVADLALHEPDPDRVAMLKELDKVSHSTDTAILIQIEIAKTLVQSVAVFDTSRRPLSPAEMDELVLSLKDELTTSLRNHVLIWSLFAYRSLTDSEIEAYISTYKNTDMQWFMRISSAALIKAMGHAAQQAGVSIGRLRNAQQI